MVSGATATPPLEPRCWHENWFLISLLLTPPGKTGRMAEINKYRGFPGLRIPFPIPGKPEINGPATRLSCNLLSGAVLLLSLSGMCGCAQHLPLVYGSPSVPRNSESAWVPPGPVVKKQGAFLDGQPGRKAFPIAREYLDSANNLTLSEIIGIALRNSRQTSQTWAQARAAAAAYASRLGSFLPNIDASASAVNEKNPELGGKFVTGTSLYSASATVSWLLLNFGGRIASVEETREALFAADWAHNAEIQNVVLQVEQAYYGYLTARSLFTAQQATVDEADTNLTATNDRHAAGLSTIADVLQAQTALSQVRLGLAGLRGQIMTMRGALATSMGLPANTPFDVVLPVEAPVREVRERTVQECLDVALKKRPDLAAARTLAFEADAHTRNVRSAAYPSLAASGSVGWLSIDTVTGNNRTYSAGLALSVPLFAGSSRYFNTVAARSQADAAYASAQNIKDLVTLQVWTSYYGLETANQMIVTGDELLKRHREPRRGPRTLQVRRWKHHRSPHCPGIARKRPGAADSGPCRLVDGRCAARARHGRVGNRLDRRCRQKSQEREKGHRAMRAYHATVRRGALILTVVSMTALLGVGCANRNSRRNTFPPAPVLVETAVSKDVPIELRQIGTVEAVNTVAVTARVGGQLEKVEFKEGQDVEKGDLLFQLDPAPFRDAYAQARANFDRDKAALTNANADVMRYQGLVEKDYVTKQAYDAAVSTAAESKAMVAGDSAAVENARLNLDYCTIVAPIAGRTGTILVKPGNLVVANSASPLVTINQIAPINVSFTIPEAQLAEVQARTPKEELRVWAYIPTDSTKLFIGALTFVDNAVDRTTGTILLKATFANVDRALWPGLYVNVGLVLGDLKSAVVIPAVAVQTSQQGDFVYVVADGDTAQMRPVARGTRSGMWVVIDKGLAVGERVITDGQLAVRQGARVMVKTGLMPAAAGEGRLP